MFLGDVLLPPTMTIFQAVEKYCRSSPERESSQTTSGRFMWSTVYTIKYRLRSTADGSFFFFFSFSFSFFFIVIFSPF